MFGKIKELLCGFKGQVTAFPTLILQQCLKRASLSDLAVFHVAGGWESSQSLYCLSTRFTVFSTAPSPVPCLPLSILAARDLPGRAEQVHANTRAPASLCSAAGQEDALLGPLCFMMLLLASLYRPDRRYCESFNVPPWAGKMVQCVKVPASKPKDLSSGLPWWKARANSSLLTWDLHTCHVGHIATPTQNK